MSGQRVQTKPPIVDGSVTVGGRRHNLRLRREFLWLDAESWFRNQASHHRRLSDAAIEKADFGFAEEMKEVAELLETMLRSRVVPTNSGLWPQFENRAQLPLWRVEDKVALERYAKLLLEFSEPAYSLTERRHFDLEADSLPGQLSVTSELRAALHYAGPYVRTTVKENLDRGESE